MRGHDIAAMDTVEVITSGKNLARSASHVRAKRSVAKAYRVVFRAGKVGEHWRVLQALRIMGNTQNRTDLVKRLNLIFADITVDPHDEPPRLPI